MDICASITCCLCSSYSMLKREEKQGERKKKKGGRENAEVPF